MTRQALRRHGGSLLGPACTQVLAAIVIATMIGLQHSVNSSLSTGARAAPAVVDVLDSASVFFGDGVYLSIVVVAVTMNLAVSRQLRDIALLRSVGASPNQIRRSVALQATATAVPASLLGAALAVPAGALWLQALRAHGVLPRETGYVWTPVAAGAAAAVVLVTSLVASYLAALRTARMKPAKALVEVGTGRAPVTRARTRAGVALVAAGALLSVVLSTAAPSQLADAGVFVLLGECIGVGLLSPVLLQRAAVGLRHAAGQGLVRVAADDLVKQARAVSGALIPLVLAGAFAGIQVGVHTTTSHAGSVEPAASRWMDYSGTVVFVAFAGVAALNCLVTVMVSRRRELATMQLAGASRRAVLGVLLVQTAMVALTALLLIAGVALLTLVPLLHATVHVWWPYYPPVALAAGAAVTLAVVAAGLVLPGARLARDRPVRAVAAAW